MHWEQRRKTYTKQLESSFLPYIFVIGISALRTKKKNLYKATRKFFFTSNFCTK
jgi:hypothetical protein